MQFPGDPGTSGREKRIVWRGGSYKLDNGYCPGTRVSRTSRTAGLRPRPSAMRTRSPCRSYRRTSRRERGARRAQPLGQRADRRSRKTRQETGIRDQPGAAERLPVGEQPSGLYVRPDPRYGLLPNLSARASSSRNHACGGSRQGRRSSYDEGPAGSVLEQTPKPGVAARSWSQGDLLVGRETSPPRPLST